jgi:hypothetical protein
MDTYFDNTLAESEGWGLFNGSEIQRIDEAGVFDSDEDALFFVGYKAAQGSEYHAHALALTKASVDEARQHTRGPWHSGGEYNVYAETPAGGLPIHICKVGPLRNGSQKERDANIQLIVTSPEMLDELVSIVGAADDPDNERPEDLVSAINWEKIRAVIAKATRKELE